MAAGVPENRRGDHLRLQPGTSTGISSWPRSHGMKIIAVAETHVHADFLSGAQAMAEATGATLYLSGHGGDAWTARWVGSHPNVMLRHDDVFRIGGIQFTARHTPGHTPEHISFVVTDIGGGADAPFGILSGDFVFVGDLGRPDLLERAAGHEGVMERSAKELAGSAKEFLKLARLHAGPARSWRRKCLRQGARSDSTNDGGV